MLRRNRGGSGAGILGRDGRSEDIAAAWHGPDDRLLLVMQSGAQLADAAGQGILGNDDGWPDALEQLVLGNQTARTLEEQFQHLQILRAKVVRFAAAAQ
jgi:hypothetical protein